MCLNDHPYFNTQKIVFDDGAVAPKANSKTLITMCPHGILTIGWQCLCSSNEFMHTETRWLIAEVLGKIPFIADIARWANMWGCSTANMLRFMKNSENIALIPGGFQEATLYQHGRHRIFIKERKGNIIL